MFWIKYSWFQPLKGRRHLFGTTGTSSSFKDLTSTVHGLFFKSHFMLWLQKCESDVLALSQIDPFLRFEILKIESLKIIFSACVNQQRKYGKENAQRTWTRRQTERWDQKLTRFIQHLWLVVGLFSISVLTVRNHFDKTELWNPFYKMNNAMSCSWTVKSTQ